MKASDVGLLPIGVEPAVARKASGAILIDGEHLADTMTCTHCGHMWIPVRGSGKVRGWCTKCNAPTCGAAGCMKCLPQEKKLDLYEKGLIITL